MIGRFVERLKSVLFSEAIPPVLISVVLAIVSYIINSSEGSTLIQSDEVWDNRVAFYADYYPMSCRYFTTYTMYFLKDVFGLKYVTGYVFLQYTLFIALGLSFYKYLRALEFSRILSNLGLVLLLGSYSVLCFSVIPLYTWDDFWQYLFTILAFLLIVKRQCLWASIAFTLGILARETTLFLYPAFLFALFVLPKIDLKQKLAAAGLPLFVYGAFSLLTFEPPSPARWHNFGKNFMNTGRSQNSVYSFLVSFGFLWATAYTAMIAQGKSLIKDPKRSFVLWGAAFTVPVVIVATFVLGLARETRLFFPPFIFVIPLTLWLFLRYRADYIRFFRKLFGLPALILLTGSMSFGLWLAPILFPEFEFRGQPVFAQKYLGVHIGLTLFLLAPLLGTLVRRSLPNDSADEVK